MREQQIRQRMEIIMMGSDTMTPAQARAKAIEEIKQ